MSQLALQESEILKVANMFAKQLRIPEITRVTFKQSPSFYTGRMNLHCDSLNIVTTCDVDIFILEREKKPNEWSYRTCVIRDAIHSIAHKIEKEEIDVIGMIRAEKPKMMMLPLQVNKVPNDSLRPKVPLKPKPVDNPLIKRKRKLILD